MAADCHAKTHVDGGPPRPKREEADYQESPASKPKQVIIEGVTYIAADAVDQVVNLGLVEAYCDMCGLEPEQDFWKGGKSTKLKSQLSAATVPKISTPAPRTISTAVAAQSRCISTAANTVGTKAVPLAQVSNHAIPKVTAKSQLSITSLPPCAPKYPTDSQESIHVDNGMSEEEHFFDEDGGRDGVYGHPTHRAIQSLYPDASPHLVNLCAISVDTSLAPKFNFRNPNRATKVCADGYVRWAD